MTNEEVDQIILQIAQGDKEIVKRLYDEYKQAIYWLAFARLKSNLFADDIVQETFIIVYQKAATYQPCGKGRAWIMGIAQKRILQRLDKESHHGWTQPLDTRLEDIHQRMEDKIEKNLHIKAMLAVLRSREQDIVLLHTLLGMKLKDIAAYLHIPRGTVYWTYNQALRKMQRYWQALEEQEQAALLTPPEKECML